MPCNLFHKIKIYCEKLLLYVRVQHHIKIKSYRNLTSPSPGKILLRVTRETLTCPQKKNNNLYTFRLGTPFCYRSGDCVSATNHRRISSPQYNGIEDVDIVHDIRVLILHCPDRPDRYLSSGKRSTKFFKK